MCVTVASERLFSMTAREKFSIGDKVRESHLYPRSRQRRQKTETAVVVGFGFLRNPFAVRVRRDGTTYTATHHMDFWEVIGSKHNDAV